MAIPIWVNSALRDIDREYVHAHNKPLAQTIHTAKAVIQDIVDQPHRPLVLMTQGKEVWFVWTIHSQEHRLEVKDNMVIYRVDGNIIEHRIVQKA